MSNINLIKSVARRHFPNDGIDVVRSNSCGRVNLTVRRGRVVRLATIDLTDMELEMARRAKQACADIQSRFNQKEAD